MLGKSSAQAAVHEDWFLRQQHGGRHPVSAHGGSFWAACAGELLRQAATVRRIDRYERQPVDARYFLFPEKLYARACAIDPHPEELRAMDALGGSGRSVYAWPKTSRRGMATELQETILNRCSTSWKGPRSAMLFPTALSYPRESGAYRRCSFRGACSPTAAAGGGGHAPSAAEEAASGCGKTRPDGGSSTVATRGPAWLSLAALRFHVLDLRECGETSCGPCDQAGGLHRGR